MANFNEALDYMLRNEGGLENNPSDPGGITNMGICLRTLAAYGLKYDWNKDGVVNDEEIKNLTKEQAATFYSNEFWLPAYDNIQNQGIANYLFDMSVNIGPSNAHRILQRATWPMTGMVLKDDGVFGDSTLYYVNHFGGPSAGCLLVTMRAERANHYRLCVCAMPNMQKFLQGWLARAYR